MIERIDAICLTGGSAFGLAAADGVMAHLAERGRGFRVGPGPEQVVPIVPTAVIFDLGRGGRFDRRPDADVRSARRRAGPRRGPVTTGAVGAGTGAQAGWLQGGVGTARTELTDGTIVAALAVVNAAGRVIDPSSGLPWSTPAAGCAARPPANARHCRCVDVDRPDRRHRRRRRPPPAAEHDDRRRRLLGAVDQGRVPQARPGRPRRAGQGGPAGALDVRRGHDLRPVDGGRRAGRTPAARALPLTGRGPWRSTPCLEAGADCFAAACTVGRRRRPIGRRARSPTATCARARSKGTSGTGA